MFEKTMYVDQIKIFNHIPKLNFQEIQRCRII